MVKSETVWQPNLTDPDLHGPRFDNRPEPMAVIRNGDNTKGEGSKVAPESYSFGPL